MSVRMLGARSELLPDVATLRLKAKHAANEIMIAVLFGIDFNCDSPCIAARMTLSADESPAVRKNCFTSFGAVG